MSESLPPDIEGQVTLRGYARTIDVTDAAATLSSLHSAGFVIITHDEWNDTPDVISAEELVAKYDQFFKPDTIVGTLEGLRSS